eukprot:TRINITY_DN5169_c0_g1_i1.p1 TRINITY_DN5169_c0_g1~~TRINITY_DN5169_c0_g1_i1.p1  ORF type:complete len:294 (+),score=33.82 TRINITY_DN5169_c0_g1_i1:111-992(+)
MSSIKSSYFTSRAGNKSDSKFSKLKVKKSQQPPAAPADINQFLNKTKENCSICLEELTLDTIRGRLACRHDGFCLECVVQWLKVTPSCPLCKTATSHVCHIDGKDGPILKQTPVEPAAQRQLSTDTRADHDNEAVLVAMQASCLVCQRDDDDENFILCDGCEDGCHTYCVGLDTVPEGDWLCARCEAEQQTFPSTRWRESREAPQSRSAHGYALDGFVVDDADHDDDLTADEEYETQDDDELSNQDLSAPRQEGDSGSSNNCKASPDIIMLDTPIRRDTKVRCTLLDLDQFAR